jgi:hypothetical protein
MVGNEAFKWRGVNLVAHFKNWYEVHSLEDNLSLVKDMVAMGFNDLWITLERALLMNYLDPETSDDYSMQFWHKLREMGKNAHQLGMRVTVFNEVNTIFVDQYGDPAGRQYVAEGPKTFASLYRPYQFCPSIPEAREIILKNHEEAFKQFPVIDAMVLWAYDNGGCGCDRCHPWPKTYFDLSKTLAKKLRAVHPGAEVYLSSWDMTDEEKCLLTELLKGDEPRTFQGIVDREWLLVDMEEEHPVDYWTKIGLPQDYLRIPFVDLAQIGAGGWRCFTSNPYPARYEKIVKALRAAGITQFGAYSEDVNDDINKYLLARLGLSTKRNAHELIKEYCLNYFQACVGDDVYEAACMMEDEFTNKFKAPWAQKPIFDTGKAAMMLSILQNVEERLPDYTINQWRWQVLIKRAEISWLLNEIGEKEAVVSEIEELFKQVLTSYRVEEAKDKLRRVLTLIDEKQAQLLELRALINDFRTHVLEEPDDRTITVLSALPSYYDWMKTFMKYEEFTTVASQKLTIKRLHVAICRGIDQGIEETPDL